MGIIEIYGEIWNPVEGNRPQKGEKCLFTRMELSDCLSLHSSMCEDTDTTASDFKLI